jgi:N-acetylglucosamine-6-phosphate deacetylase
VISLVGRLLAPEDRGVRLVTVEEGRVVRIDDADAAPADARGGLESWIIPGLVDIQLNGAFGVDFSHPDADLAVAAEALPATGVTAFVPTVVSAPPDRYGPCLANLARPVVGGARAIGVHLEGPYLSPKRAGTHDPAALRAPSIGEADAWLGAGDVRIVTLAPELPGAVALIEWFVSRGVLVAIGHTNATWGEADAAIAAGARLGTHLFNAMRPFHHRDPGVAGRLLGPGVAVSLVADGVHVAPETIGLVAAIKGSDDIVLVSDGVAALGEPPGRSRLGSQEVISDGTVARLADGTISGSVTPMATAVGRLIAAGLDPEAVVRAASTNPARLIGVADDHGSIEVGRPADLVLLDSDWRPLLTLLAGQPASG